MIANIGQKPTKDDLKALNTAVNNEENPIVYLAIDPGETCGFTGYDAEYGLQFMLPVATIDVIRFLYQFDKIKTCVIEDYRVYPHKANDHIYSKLETPKIIGRVEAWAELKEVELVKQPASIKPTGYAWIGKKPLPRSNPLNHAMDAHVHFMYWAVMHKRIKARDLLK